MLDRHTLKALARMRLKDAKVLLRGNQHDGAMYLCGYAIELGLKARICQTLRWPGFPSTSICLALKAESELPC